MATFADGDEPFDGFPADFLFGVPLVMDLRSGCTAIDATPVVSFEYNVTFPSPGIRFEIHVSVKVSAAPKHPLKIQIRLPIRF